MWRSEGVGAKERSGEIASAEYARNEMSWRPKAGAKERLGKGASAIEALAGCQSGYALPVTFCEVSSTKGMRLWRTKNPPKGR